MYSEFMQIAINEAKNADIDVPVGAVLVCNNEIISKSHNEKEKNNDITAHAEIIAIKKAEQVKHNWRLDDCELYVTLEPCPMCASAIISSRIKKVYFGAYDALYGALGSKLDLRNIYNSKLEVLGGIMEEECSALLKDFWRKNG